MSGDRRTIGHQGGSLSQRMEGMNRVIEDTDRVIEDMKRASDRLIADKYLDRIIDLMNQSVHYDYDSEERQKWDARACHANIERDLETLAWVQEYDRHLLPPAKEGFEVVYGLPFSKASSLIPIAPEEVIKFIDVRCELNFMGYYLYSMHNTQELLAMEQLCTDIFDLWEKSYLHGTAYPKEEIQAKISEYNRLHSIWEEGWKLDLEDTDDPVSSSGET